MFNSRFAGAQAQLVLVLLGCKATEDIVPLLFIQQPVSQNISERSQAIFNCTAYYSFGSYWLVNEQPLAHSTNTNRGIIESEQPLTNNLAIHLLSIPGNTNNNDITVQCFIYSFNKTIGSDIGKLRIQGILDKVINLQAVWLTTSSIQVSFSPPHTLDGVPITNYTINLSQDTTSMKADNQYDSVGNISLSTQSQSNIVTNLSWCVTYNISVSAWNSVGEGHETFLVKQGLLEPLKPFNVTVNRHSSNNKQIILLDMIVNKSYPYVPQNFNVSVGATITLSTYCIVNILICDDKNFKLRKPENSDNWPDLIHVAINLTDYIMTLKAGSYNVTVSMGNCNGIANTSTITVFSAQRLDNTGTDLPPFSNHHALTSVSTSLLSTMMYQVSHTIELKVHSMPDSSQQLIQPTYSSSDVADIPFSTDDNRGMINTLQISGLIFFGVSLFIIALIFMLILLVAIMYRRNKKLFRFNFGSNLQHYEEVVIDNKKGNQQGYPECFNPLSGIPLSSTYETINDITTSCPATTSQQVSTSPDDVQLMNCPAYMDPRVAAVAHQ